MIRTIYFLLSLLIIILVSSCGEEVIQLDLDTSKERLVIEALIKWDKNNDGKNQVIKLSKTTSYYNSSIVPATGASVIITNDTTGDEFIFTETENGIYRTSSFIPVTNADYSLNVNYNNIIYTATEKLLAAPSIDKITQEDSSDLTEDDLRIINVFFDDVKDVENFYRLRGIDIKNSEVKNEFFSDEYIEDIKTVEVSLFFEGLRTGNKVDIELSSMTEQFQDYYTLLQTQADADGGPFSTPPANVKGNIINKTNVEDYPYGYFSLSQISKASYTYK